MTTWRSYFLDCIDLLAEQANEEIRLQAARARQQIKRFAEFPARSEGQKRRFAAIRQGENK